MHNPIAHISVPIEAMAKEMKNLHLNFYTVGNEKYGECSIGRLDNENIWSR